MLDYNVNYTDWVSFLITGLIIALLWLSVKLLFHYFLRSFTHTRKIFSINYLILADRLLRITLASILIIAFIKVNPVIHGALILVLLVVAYSLLKDMIIGLTIIPKLNLLRENHIISGKHKGTIEELRWLGIFLNNQSEEKYLPYSYLYHHGFIQKENNFTSVLRFECTEPAARNIVRESIRKKLFMLPFIAQDSIPDIRFSESEIEVELDITSNKYEESIINAIEEIRLENTTIKAI